MSEDNSPGGAEDVSEEELDEIQAGAGQGSSDAGGTGRGKFAAESPGGTGRGRLFAESPGESAPAAENPNS